MILRTHHLSKHFGGIALDDVPLELPPGSVLLMSFFSNPIKQLKSIGVSHE